MREGVADVLKRIEEKHGSRHECLTNKAHTWLKSCSCGGKWPCPNSDVVKLARALDEAPRIADNVLKACVTDEEREAATTIRNLTIAYVQRTLAEVAGVSDE